LIIKQHFHVGFEVFTAVVMKSIIFWDMMPCVVRRVSTDVLEEHISSIFRVEEIISAKGLPPACLLVFAELISSTLKMEAKCSSKMSVETRRTTRRHIPEDDTLLNISILHEPIIFLGAWNRVLDALIRVVAQVIKKFLDFHEPEGSLLYSQKPTVGPSLS
jgi:hypothetical protein